MIALSQFDFLQVNFTPTKDLQINKKFDELEIKPIQFESRFIEDRDCFFTSMTIFGESDSYFSTVIHLHKHLSELDNSVIAESRVLFKELFAAHSEEFDFFIVGETDTFLESNFKTRNDLNFKDAFRLIRILLVNNGFYYLAPRYKINEGYYYLYRFKKIFASFQNAWTIVLNLNESNDESKLVNQFDSLSQRLDFICRATDKLSFEALKIANNDTQDNVLYHFGYFVMLITGVFDDLAWILNYLYNLNLNKMDVVLKNTRKNTMYIKLKQHNQDLYQYLLQEDTQNKINLFYPLRDTLQHRRFIKGMVYSENGGQKVNLFEFPKRTVEILEKVSNYKYIKDYGLVNELNERNHFDVYVFSNKSLELVSNLVNEILNRIDWEQIMSNLPPNRIDEIKESKQRFEAGVHSFLGFSVKPLYFDY